MSALFMRRSFGALLAALAAARVTAGSPALARTIPEVDPSRLGSHPVGEIKDVLLRERPVLARSAAWNPPPGSSGGVYQAGGMAIRIFASPKFEPNPVLDQAWAAFFAGLPQAGDAASMVVYFVTPPEMTAICSSRAAACYSPSDNLMILTGDSTAVDNTPIEEVAAHEFAHHIANRRSNDPWRAVDWGPKRWATEAGICPGVLAKRFFPGNQGSRYAKDPGEGWAETYRVSAGGDASSWEIVDSVFFPRAGAREAALLDAREPWAGNTKQSWTTKVSGGAPPTRKFQIRTPLDGRFEVRSASSPGLNIDLFIRSSDGRRTWARGKRTGPYESARTYSCGDKSLLIEARRKSRQGGSFTLTLTSAR